MYHPPDDDELRTLLRKVRRIAVVGLSPRPNRPSHGVAKHLIELGYDIVPVRPAVREVLGRPACATLADVQGPVDLVNVFVSPERVGGIVDQAIAIGAPAIWLQLGVVDTAAAERAQRAGLTVVMDRCIYEECVRLLPGS